MLGNSLEKKNLHALSFRYLQGNNVIEANVRKQTNLNWSFYKTTQYRSNSVSPKECIFIKLKNNLYILCVIKKKQKTSQLGNYHRAQGTAWAQNIL